MHDEGNKRNHVGGQATERIIAVFESLETNFPTPASNGGCELAG
jgi:hypothetical protein